jgi:hypothetical protein
MRPPLNSDDAGMLARYLEEGKNGLSLAEVKAFERVLAFLERPTPRDIDEIAESMNLRDDETHAVEQTVRALWGKP